MLSENQQLGVCATGSLYFHANSCSCSSINVLEIIIEYFVKPIIAVNSKKAVH